LDDLTSSSVRRFVQNKVINHGIKLRTLHTTPYIKLKLPSQYRLKENYMKSEFIVDIPAPKSDKELQKLFHYLEADKRPLAF